MREGLRFEDLDFIDWKIIAELQRDGRRSLTELGRRVGLSHPSVRARMRRLVDRGVMRVQAGVDLGRLGFRFAIMNLEFEDMASAYRFIEGVKPCPRIIFLCTRRSMPVVSMMVAYRMAEELEAFMERRVREATGLRRTSIEFCFMHKPVYMPYLVSDARESCGEECPRCGLRLPPALCPGCCAEKLWVKA